MACIVLHNYLMRKSSDENESVYCPSDFADTILPDGSVEDGEWRTEGGAFQNMDSCFSRNFSRNAEEVRNSFVQYFNTVGAVDWQNQYAHVF